MAITFAARLLLGMQAALAQEFAGHVGTPPARLPKAIVTVINDDTKISVLSQMAELKT